MGCHGFYFSTLGNLSPLMLLALKQRAKHVLFSIEQNLEYGTGVFIFWDCGFAPLNVEMADLWLTTPRIVPCVHVTVAVVKKSFTIS